MSNTTNKLLRPKSKSISTSQNSPTISDVDSAAPAVFEVGGWSFRIDLGMIENVSDPHLTSQQWARSESTELNSTLTTEAPVEMGLGDVLENNRALQQAAREMASAVIVPSTLGGPLCIQPAWEVERFRWPRIAKRFLVSHPDLFEQIGNGFLKMLQPTRRRIGITSTVRGEGKSTIAICLARWAAQSKLRTLLIDADVENPQLTIMSGLNASFGWRSAIQRDIPMSEVMVRSAESGLSMMPAQPLERPKIQEKSLDRLGMITFQMKYEFDIVIIDLGTIDNICVHGKEGMDVVDAVLVVRDSAKTTVGQLMDTKQVLANLGMRKSYVAENFVLPRAA